MKITTQEEYALRCALQLARRYGGAPVTVAEIGKAEGLSGEYVNKLLARLRKGGIVQSVRGVRGGYVLAKAPGAANLADVLQAASGPLFDLAHCKTKYHGHSGECLHTSDCGIRSVWVRVVEQINSVLAHTTLADLLEDERRVSTVLSERLIPLSPVRNAARATASVPA